MKRLVDSTLRSVPNEILTGADAWRADGTADEVDARSTVGCGAPAVAARGEEKEVEVEVDVEVEVADEAEEEATYAEAGDSHAALGVRVFWIPVSEEEALSCRLLLPAEEEAEGRT
jgi:hypothetical protein